MDYENTTLYHLYLLTAITKVCSHMVASLQVQWRTGQTVARRHLLFWRELTVHQSSIDGRASRSFHAIQAHQSQETDTKYVALRVFWRREVLY